MPDDRRSNRVELDVEAGRGLAPARPLPDTPFVIGILGDFSGRGAGPAGAHAAPPLDERRPLFVDRDNVDEVLGRLAPEIPVTLEDRESPELLRFRELEDFHPERLFERLPFFAELREMRSESADPRRFAAAAAAAERRRAQASAPPPAPDLPEGNLLDSMLEAADGAAPLVRARGDLSTYIEHVLKPHLVPGPDPRQAEMLGRVDATIGHHLRIFLHDPAVQALEALWRSVDWLTRRLDTSSQLALYLIDVTQDELAADLAGDRPLERSGLARLLVRGAAGAAEGAPWSLLACNYVFGPESGDVALLDRLGQFGAALGAPVLAGAAPRLVGTDTLQDVPDLAEWDAEPGAAWSDLRRRPQAHFLGLVLPRLLLRLPYGGDAEPVESIRFEEVTEGMNAREDYLWGNAAMLVAFLIGDAFASDGWRMRPGSVLEVDGLPFHLLRGAGETHALPCAEVLLTEAAAARILERGVMPLATLRDSDRVRLVRLQSIADPLAPLAGRWAGAHPV